MKPNKIWDLDDSWEFGDLSPKDSTPKTKMELQKEIAKNKPATQMTKEELKYVTHSPVASAIYTKTLEEKDVSVPKKLTPNKEKFHWKQKVKCRHCGAEINKGSYARHRKTQKCQIYQQMDLKFKELILK